MRRFPQGADLLFHPLGRKDVLLHTQLNQVLQMGSFGIVEASLPLTDGAAGDPQQGGQARLRQANAGAQLEYELPKGIVALTIGVPGHRRAACLPRDPAAPPQPGEATGKQHATCWRLTSLATPAILGSVGCALSGSTLIGGTGEPRKTPDSPCKFILLRIAHFARTCEAVSSCDSGAWLPDTK